MSSPPVCPNCGAQSRRPDARFCQNCGYPLTTASATQAPRSAMTGRAPWFWIAAALLVLLLLGGAGFFVWRTHDTKTSQRYPPPAEIPNSLPTAQPSVHPIPTSPTAHSSGVTPTPSPMLTPTGNASIPSSIQSPTPTQTTLSTATPSPTPTATPEPLAHTTEVVWLRTGPGTDYQRIRKLARGETLILRGRNAEISWLQVETEPKEAGWVSAYYIDPGAVVLSSLPEASAPPLPTCQIPVDNRFRSIYRRDQLGCPTNPAHMTWAAWEPFQGGAMLWRDDSNQVIVFYQRDGWITLPDQWQGEATPWRGDPPPGLRQPVRGFGWIWGNHDDVFNRLGWATDEEKGVCLWVQDFQKGFAFLKSDIPYCSDRAGNSNYNRAAELPNLSIVAHDNGRAWRMY